MAAHKTEVKDAYKYMTEGQVGSVRRYFAGLSTDRKGTIGWLNHRDKVIFELMFATGLRRFEVCGLDVGHIRDRRLLRDDTDLLSVVGKGKKLRHIPVRSSLRKILDGYLKDKRKRGEDMTDDAPLFCSRNRECGPEGGDNLRLSLRRLNEIITNRCKAAGIEGITPHMLRHTFGRRFINNSESEGRALVNLQRLLGHSRPTTTVIYVKSTLADIGHDMERMPK